MRDCSGCTHRKKYADMYCDDCIRIVHIHRNVCYDKFTNEKEEHMEKELEFSDTLINIYMLQAKGACDEGMLWFVKKYCHEGRRYPCIEDVYNDVPKLIWKDWLKEKFPEYIKEKKPKYCCESFDDFINARDGRWYHFSLAEGLIKSNDNGFYIYPKRDGGCNFSISHCPFCGKTLEVK